MPSHNVLVFGSEAVDSVAALGDLHNLAKSRPQLHHFLQLAVRAIRSHLLELSIADRSLFDGLPSIIDRVDRNESQGAPSALCSSVLLTIIQIGEFLVYVEDNPHLDAANAGASYAGLGVGLLAACAAAAARRANDIVTIGVQAVLISLNIAVELGHRTNLIVGGGETQWASAVVEMPQSNVQSHLEEHSSKIPALKKAYISVVGDTWVTVSGPLSTLEQATNLDVFQGKVSTFSTNATALHAAHLSGLDVKKLVPQSPILETSWSSSSCFSTGRCVPFVLKTLRGVFCLAVDDILQRPCRLGETVANVASTVKGEGGDDVSVVGFGEFPPPVSQLLRERLGEVRRHVPLQPQDETGSSSGHIAIIGMSGRFPGADTLDELWGLLQGGKDVHQRIPSTRFNLSEFYDPSGEKKNSILTRYGCFLKHPGDFDARFFNIAPREAAQMDPLQRIFLMATYEALEMAGYNPNSAMVDKSRISTYFGQSTDDWRTINEQEGIQAHYLPCTNRSFAPGRVNHHFQWGGGYYSIDTGCSSSATAIHLACAALNAHECNMSVVGGGNICVIPEYFSGFSRGDFLSRTGACKTFSDTADGYCRGEAVATVVLKRLEDAVAANDNILGVISATARNTNAGEGSITYPGKASQVDLLKTVLARSGTSPSEVGFVEMHGTGTQAGDLVEINTVRSVLGRSPEQPLYVGALKANIGHSEAAAGISSLVKALLMLHNDKIPQQPGKFVLNKGFSDLSEAGIHIADGSAPSIPRSKVDGKRKLLVNSFDAAGGNTSLLLQDGPARGETKRDPRTHHIVICSARTIQSLRRNKDRLRKHLEAHPVDLADLSYTTTARRMQHAYTETYVVESVPQLIESLSKPQQPQQPFSQLSQQPSLVFVFTGQGSQYTAMGATLYTTSPRFQRKLDAYESLSIRQGLASFLDVIRGTTDIASAKPTQVQLAIVALEIALAEFLLELGMKPTLVMGHSLGEYSALCVAGVLSVSDTLYLVHHRAVLMEKHCTAGAFGMTAVPLSAEKARKTLEMARSPCEICCLNSPESTVIGGATDLLESFEGMLGEMGLQPKRLRVPYALHSAQMDPILGEFRRIASGIQFGQPRVPVASTLIGGLVTSAGVFGVSYLVQQVRQPVNFIGAVNTCHAAGLIIDSSAVVEIGPRPLCISLLTVCLPTLQLVSLPTLRPGHSDWESISNCLAALHNSRRCVNWEAFHDDNRSGLSLVNLPSYAFDTTNYWTPYKVQPGQAGALPSHGSSVQTPSAYMSTGVQWLEYASDDNLSASFISPVAEASLLNIIQGHVVNDVAICPASLFIDMACAAAHALSTPGASGRNLEVLDLNMTQPLGVSNPDTERIIRIKAAVNQESGAITIQTSSESLDVPTEHATCQVIFHAEWLPNMSLWPQVRSLVQRRVESLLGSPSPSSCHRMSKGLMYKLFESVVDYSTVFRVLDNVIVDENFQDAVAELDIPKATNQKSPRLDPFTLDALVHLPGFLLNCNLQKPKDDIHIAKSIGRVVILDKFLVREGPLTCYATITGQDGEGSTLCDVYVFQDNTLAALVSKICFQKISRGVFDLLVHSLGGHPAPMIAPVSQSEAVPSQSPQQSPRGGEPPYSVLLRTIAAKTGIDIGEVMSAGCFSELGVDSHMGISIIAEFNRETGMLLPAAFFNNLPTLKEAEQELRGEDLHSSPSNESIPEENRTPDSGMSEPCTSHPTKMIGEDQSMNCQQENIPGNKEQACAQQSPKTNDQDRQRPKGRAILLQGKANSKTTPLFLVTESSGSVAVYTHFPPLPDNRPIYGLESPFLEHPEDNTLSVQEMARAHITTMRSVQPNGPYLLGGYSFAGLYAYEIAYQLAQDGERLLGLMLIDMYVPPPAFMGMKRFSLDGIGTGALANVTMRISQMFPAFTENQKVHMAGSMRAAACYTPIPIPGGSTPHQTHIIWATKGVNENSHPEEHEDALQGPAWMGVLGKPWEELTEAEMATMLKSWFFARRETFGTNGWERLVGADVHLHRVEADHLSIVAPPTVQELGKAIVQVVEDCTRQDSAS